MSKVVRVPPIVERRGSIVPPIPSRPHHAASQKRPPRAETRKTGPAQSMSKVVRGLPIVERRGSIALGVCIEKTGHFQSTSWEKKREKRGNTHARSSSSSDLSRAFSHLLNHGLASTTILMD